MRAAMNSREARARMQKEKESAEHQRAKARHVEHMFETSRSNSFPTANRAMWESHMAALESLKSRAVGSLREVDFPWPPMHNIAFFTPSCDLREKKKKVSKATLHWHPDKFEQKYGALLKPEETKRIHDRVRELSARYIQLRHVLNQYPC